MSGQEDTTRSTEGGGERGRGNKRGGRGDGWRSMIGHVTVIRIKGREDTPVQRGLDQITCGYNAPEYENGALPIPDVFRSSRGSHWRSTFDTEDTQQATEHLYCSTGSQIQFWKGKHEWFLRMVRSIGWKVVRTVGQGQGGQRTTLGGRGVLQCSSLEPRVPHGGRMEEEG